MFNVCPGCGEYTDAKEVRKSPARTVCPACHYEHNFLSLPLFVITGASGSGKTTAALELVSATKDFVVLDQDILWNDSYNQPENDFQLFRNTWLRMVKNINQAGKPVVLFGTSIPQQYESCTERRYLSRIHYLALVCDSNELKRRLKERPQWRKSGDEANLDRMVQFNHWLNENAARTEPRMDLLDTTTITVEASVKAIQEWLYTALSSETSLAET